MTFLQGLLWPLSVVYEAAVRLRARAYRTGAFRAQRVDGVVISVGNLTVGGTGKTPMVLWLAKRLIEEGNRVAILTRGFKGGFRGCAQMDANVSASGDPAIRARRQFSDETYLFFRRLACSPDHAAKFAVGVSLDRHSRGRELSSIGFHWFIADDGFQHQKLARDLDIVLIDATNPFGGGHLLPAGRLREPKSALARTDIVVITRSQHAPAVEAAIRRDSEAPIFYASLKLDEIVPVTNGEGCPATMPRGTKFFAFCGIGNPAAFLVNLREWGIEIAGAKSFGDHHVFSAKDASRILAQARAAGASALLCTEKDYMNLVPNDFPVIPLYYCRVSLTLSDSDGFWREARSILARKRPEARP